MKDTSLQTTKAATQAKMHADNSIDEDEDNNALGNPTLEGCQEHDHNAPESANQEPEVPLDLRTFQVACLIINKVRFSPCPLSRIIFAT